MQHPIQFYALRRFNCSMTGLEYKPGDTYEPTQDSPEQYILSLTSQNFIGPIKGTKVKDSVIDDNDYLQEGVSLAEYENMQSTSNSGDSDESNNTDKSIPNTVSEGSPDSDVAASDSTESTVATVETASETTSDEDSTETSFPVTKEQALEYIKDIQDKVILLQVGDAFKANLRRNKNASNLKKDLISFLGK